MPIYNTKCESCTTELEQKLSFEVFGKLQNGEIKLTCSCGGNTVLKFDPSTVKFSMHDGPSGGWTSKAAKENNYRKSRNVDLDRRTRDHVSKKNLVPNYNGIETPTWRDAQAEAQAAAFSKVQPTLGVSGAKKAAELAGKSYDKYVKKEATK